MSEVEQRGGTIVELSTGAPFGVIGADDGVPDGLLRFLPAPAPAAADVVPVTAADRPAPPLPGAHRFSAVAVSSVAQLSLLASRDADFLVLAPSVSDLRAGDHVAAELAAVVAYARARSCEVVALGIADQRHHDALRALGVRYGAGTHVDERLRRSSGLLDDGGEGAGRLSWLRTRLAAATTAGEAASAACDHVAELGLLPSLYVERHGVLRCIASGATGR